MPELPGNSEPMVGIARVLPNTPLHVPAAGIVLCEVLGVARAW